MQTQKQISDLIKKELPNIQIGNVPNLLYDPIKYALQVGGKRIRPTLCLMATDMFGGNTSDSINAAIGLEIFHNFTLLHDDIMDNATVRRGNPTIHVKWTKNIAILSGDAMSIIACRYIAKTVKNHDKVVDLFMQTAIEICEGQQYDMDFESEYNVSEDDYIKMINFKTAVFLAASLKIGALIANANDSDCENIYQFGRYMGLAFQLQDDLLDTFGDVKTFGKDIGGDIVENKKTYLLIKALQAANDTERNELIKWISAKDFDKTEKIKAVKSIYEKLDVKKFTIDLIEEYYKEANKYLSMVSISETQKVVLSEYMDSMKHRNY